MSYYTGHGVTVHHADALELLPTLHDSSVDAVVTDPPYGLEFMGKDWDKFKTAGHDHLRHTQRMDTAPTTKQGNPWASERKSYGAVKKNPRCRRCGHLLFTRYPCQCAQPDWDLRITESMHQFQAWCEQWATECLRILKPGGHLLAFGGTRTSHRLASGVEDAGFEIRDSLIWLYGSGFPKSLDVSKAIDKARHAADDVRRATAWIAAHATARQLDEAAGTNGMGGHWTTQGAQAAVPTAEAWASIAGLLPEPPGWLRALIKPARQPGEAWDQRPITQVELRPLVSGEHITFDQRSSKERERRDIPATDDAQRWAGWGTALKPGHEPIVVARKPLQGTVAANVLAWGTGAINIDGCRIEGETLRDPLKADGTRSQKVGHDGWDRPWKHGEQRLETPNAAGRWPANVVLDEAAANELDQQSGEQRDGIAIQRHGGGQRIFNTGDGLTRDDQGYGGSGGASRFFLVVDEDDASNRSIDVTPGSRMFYTAKADANERPTLPKPGAGEGRVTGLGGKIRECNVCGSRAVNSGANELSCGHNDHKWVENPRPEVIAHPTVKPLSLMRWLVRLVTPPGGLVLDPFAGSGTTAEACILEGFRCVAVEREADYLPMIVQRVNRRRDPAKTIPRDNIPSLFDLLGEATS